MWLWEVLCFRKNSWNYKPRVLFDSRLNISWIIHAVFHELCEIERKFSNSKSDLQGHYRSPIAVPFDRPHTISYLPSVATISLSCTVSEILSLIFRNSKSLRDMADLGVIYHAQNLATVASAVPEIWLRASKLKMDYVALTTPLLGVVCHP